ncbi:hypothetical protein P8610_12575 [Fictibacillus sp. UD]|uniref:hypothetical protein n=1 Tax=Fictibacillus sp. UD TaxID=3038777 RepID=UPI0037469B25
MENKLKNLNRTMDEHMSSTPVFTNKDEQNILLAIRDKSTRKTTKRKNTFVPRLLTAALFAGVIFTSYHLMDNYLKPETATEIEKPEVRYAQELTQASSMLTFEASTRELTIKGTVNNTTDYNSEPFQAKVNILNEDVADALGTKSLTLDVPPNHFLKPDEPYSFEKVVTVELGIVDENTFKDAIEVEIYTKTKTLTSFVIDDITFNTNEVKEPDTEDKLVVEENETEETPSTNQDKKTEQEDIEEVNQTAKESIEDLEKQYGKKRTPFNNIDVTNKNDLFYVNNITLGVTLEEALQTLGPYDNYNDQDYHSPVYASWNFKNAAEESELYLEISEPGKKGKVSYIGFKTLDRAYVENWVNQLGKPFLEKTSSKFYYEEKSQQMLIIQDWKTHYDISLQTETNLELYKKEN